MKKIIYTEINCELDNYKSKKGIGLVHENIWSSFIKDTYSFFYFGFKFLDKRQFYRLKSFKRLSNDSVASFGR